MQGSIFLNRKILDSSVFASEKRFKIWVWCLLKANYKNRFTAIRIGKGEKTIEVKRGQFVFGRFKAEEALNIDGSTIYKSLKSFEKDEMIEIQSNSHYTIITICNYDTYQTLNNTEVTTTEQPLNNYSTAINQPLNTNNKDNKEKKVKESKEYIYPTFDEFKIYSLENQVNTDLHKLELKFKSWSENDWNDGNGKKIKNWKSKILNTLSYLKTETNGKTISDIEREKFINGRIKIHTSPNN